MRVNHLNCMTFNLGYPAVTHCLLMETEEGLVLVDSGLGTRDYTNPSRFMDWFMSLNKVPRDMEETAIRQVAALGYAPEDVRHIVLTHMHIEMEEGLVLVDSGLGTRDYTNPSRFMDWFMGLNKVPRDMGETTIRQVADLGYAPEDVRHIVLTHMHIDHAGGLPDFPWAKVHVFEAEYQAAMNRRRFSVKERFYSSAHWAHSPDWELHSLDGEEWFVSTARLC